MWLLERGLVAEEDTRGYLYRGQGTQCMAHCTLYGAGGVRGCAGGSSGCGWGWGGRGVQQCVWGGAGMYGEGEGQGRRRTEGGAGREEQQQQQPQTPGCAIHGRRPHAPPAVQLPEAPSPPRPSGGTEQACRSVMCPCPPLAAQRYYTSPVMSDAARPAGGGEGETGMRWGKGHGRQVGKGG